MTGVTYNRVMPSGGLFGIIHRYFWLICIAVTCANGAIWWRRAQVRIAARPDLEPGYRRLIRGWLIYGNIPWIVMGIGVMSGNAAGIFSYFSPRNGPFVLAWYASVVLVWILCGFWLFFMRGAEQLVAHPGLLNLPAQDPRFIKAFFVISVAAGVVTLTMLLLDKVAPMAP